MKKVITGKTQNLYILLAFLLITIALLIAVSIYFHLIKYLIYLIKIAIKILILIDKKTFAHILVYNISYKSLIDSKHLSITFNKIDGFVRVYDGTRYLVLFGSEKYDPIYNYAKIKVDSLDSFPLAKNMTFHYVIILIKSVFDKK